MKNARNNNRRSPQRSARPQRPLTKTRIQSRRPAPRPRKTWPRRFLGWIATANKAVLAAIGAGLLGAITASVIGMLHLLAASVQGSPPPLTAVGIPSPNNSPPADPYDLGGTFVVPGTPHPAHILSTGQMSVLLQDAAGANSTYGEYVLQAQPGQTVVIIAIHTILMKRAPAQSGTVVTTVTRPPPRPPMTVYRLSVDLDTPNPAPAVYIVDEATGNTIWVPDFQGIVTYAAPTLIDFDAHTSKYDVKWKFRIDYTVNGQLHTAMIENGSQPFHTEAVQSDDSAGTYYINGDETLWTFRNGT